jgi:hypothetical protein
MTFVFMARLSYRKSALYVLFANIPPTFAAAKKTYSGSSRAKKSSTAF